MDCWIQNYCGEGKSTHIIDMQGKSTFTFYLGKWMYIFWQCSISLIFILNSAGGKSSEENAYSFHNSLSVNSHL